LIQLRAELDDKVVRHFKNPIGCELIRATTTAIFEGMSDQDVARFRAQADECRQLAEQAINALDKEAWLRLAGEWVKLAQEADKRLRYRSPLRE
jgi:hypothetical protein